MYEGSGGGGYVIETNSNITKVVSNAGFGGGFIYIEGNLLNIDGRIECNGGVPNK